MWLERSHFFCPSASKGYFRKCLQPKDTFESILWKHLDKEWLRSNHNHSLFKGYFRKCFLGGPSGPFERPTPLIKIHNNIGYWTPMQFALKYQFYHGQTHNPGHYQHIMTLLLNHPSRPYTSDVGF